MIARILSSISSVFPFSLGEMAIFIGIILFLLYTLRLLLKYLKNQSMKFMRPIPWHRFIRNGITSLLIVLLTFQLVWGLNYSRLPLKSVLDLEVKPRTSEELYDTLVWHIKKANDIGKSLTPEMYEGHYDLWQGYEALPEDLAILAQVEGKAKDLISSEIFSYAGIAGIYNPFFAEPNYNRLQVEYMHPVVIAHELAHLQGVAREDEANFTAVAVCLSHEEPLVNYSGHMLAIIHMSNALYNTDMDLWINANEQINDHVRADLDRNNAFWKRYEGWFEEASSNLNDTYLKANGLEDGVMSYGRMVDLLLATKELFYTSF